MPNETNTPEPLAAILAEMRDERIVRIEDADATRCLLHNLADRIDAAAAQTRTDLDAARAALASLEEELERLRAPGNAAALREALEDAHRLIEAFLATVGDRGMRSKFVEMRHRIDAAIAAPARNCDRFASATDEVVDILAGELRAHCLRLSGAEYYITPEQTIRWILDPAKGGAE